jgi:hypothetical protein
MFQSAQSATQSRQGITALRKKGEAGASPGNTCSGAYFAGTTTLASFSFTSVAPLPRRLRR